MRRKENKTDLAARSSNARLKSLYKESLRLELYETNKMENLGQRWWWCGL
jgi:hypothetical protein